MKNYELLGTVAQVTFSVGLEIRVHVLMFQIFENSVRFHVKNLVEKGLLHFLPFLLRCEFECAASQAMLLQQLVPVFSFGETGSISRRHQIYTQSSLVQPSAEDSKRKKRDNHY